MNRRFWTRMAWLCVLAACGGGSTAPDPNAMDVKYRFSKDTGSKDVPLADPGEPDLPVKDDGAPDPGPPDLGPADPGQSEDPGHDDGGTPDPGPPETGPEDPGVVDVGVDSGQDLQDANACGPDGEPCDDGDPCTVNDRCDRGECVGTAIQCLDDGLPCTADMCKGGVCIAEMKPHTCLVAGICYSEGQPNPFNPCEKCVSAGTQKAWTPLNGDLCDDGDPCTGPDTCAAGHCQPGKDTCGPPVCTTHEDCYPDKICGMWFTDNKLRCSAPCVGPAQCGPGETCTHAPGTANVGYCQPSPNPAGGGTGAWCASGWGCVSGFCVMSQCANACSGQAGCVAGVETCQAVGSLTEGMSGACLPDAGSAGFPMGQVCTLNGQAYDSALCRSGHCDLLGNPSKCAPLCHTDKQCGVGQECNIVMRTNGPVADAVPYATVFPTKTYDTLLGCFTRTYPGTLETGAVCNAPSDCKTNKCFGLKPGDATKYCTTFCATDADCPPTMACKLDGATVVSAWLGNTGIGSQGNVPNGYTLARICKLK